MVNSDLKTTGIPRLILALVALAFGIIFVVSVVEWRQSALVIKGAAGLDSGVFWRSRSTALIRGDTVSLPATYPGPLDGWAGGDIKEIAIDLPTDGPYHLTLTLTDSHDVAPPLIVVRRNGIDVGDIQVEQGAGSPEERREEEGISSRYTLFLKEGGTSLTLRTEKGSWMAIDELRLEAPLPTGRILLAGIGLAFALFFFTGVVSSAALDIDKRGRRRIVSGIAATLLLFFLPNPASTLFDGLPLATPIETVGVMVTIPLLLIVGWRFLATVWGTPILWILVLLKLIVGIVAPDAGMKVWIYDTPADMANEKWQPTYETIFDPTASATIRRPVIRAVDLPVDWLWRRDVRFTRIAYPRPRIERAPDQGADWIGLNLEGWIRLEPGERLIFVGSGVISHSLVSVDETGAKYPLAMTGFFDPVSSAAGPIGTVKVEGELIFSNESRQAYGFDLIVIAPDGTERSALTDHRIAPEPPDAIKSGAIAGMMTTIIDWAIIFVAAVWLFWGLAFRFNRREIDLYIIVGGLAATLTGYATVFHPSFFPFWVGGATMAVVVLGVTLIALLREKVDTGRFVGIAALSVAATAGYLGVMYIDCNGGAWTPLGLSALVMATLLVCWAMTDTGLDEKAQRHIVPFLVIFAPLLFFHYLPVWWDGFYAYKPHLPLSDSLTYQIFAREIFIGGDWLHATGEPVTFYQFLYRYVVGFLHLLFGQAVVAQQLLDIWSMLTVSAALFALGHRVGLGPAWWYATAGLYLTNMLGPHFAWHIGLGMQELTCNLFLFGAILVALLYGIAGGMAFVVGGLSGAGFLTRIDRMGVCITVALLTVIDRRSGKGVLADWKELFAKIISNWRRLGLAAGLVAIAAGLLIIRNGIIGDSFVLNDESNLELVTCVGLDCVLKNYEQILFGSNRCTDRAAFVMITGAVVAILALIFRPAAMRFVPLELSLFLAAALAPYWIGGPMGFEPRFSMHVLPIATAVALFFVAGVVSPKQATPDGDQPPPT